MAPLRWCRTAGRADRPYVRSRSSLRRKLDGQRQHEAGRSTEHQRRNWSSSASRSPTTVTGPRRVLPRRRDRHGAPSRAWQQRGQRARRSGRAAAAAVQQYRLVAAAARPESGHALPLATRRRSRRAPSTARRRHPDRSETRLGRLGDAVVALPALVLELDGLDRDGVGVGVEVRAAPGTRRPSSGRPCTRCAFWPASL